jgi:hypothetical protein
VVTTVAVAPVTKAIHGFGYTHPVPYVTLAIPKMGVLSVRLGRRK